MDAVMVAAATASVGLVAGGLGDGAFAGGEAPWAPPLGAVALGGLGYAAATAVSRETGDSEGSAVCVRSVLHSLVVLQSPYDIIMTLLAVVGPVIRARQQPAPGGKLGDSFPYSPKMLRNSAFPATTLGMYTPPDPCARTLRSSLLR